MYMYLYKIIYIYIQRFSLIGGQRRLELFSSSDDNKRSSIADHDEDDAEFEDYYNDDAHKVSAVICID